MRNSLVAMTVLGAIAATAIITSNHSPDITTQLAANRASSDTIVGCWTQKNGNMKVKAVGGVGKAKCPRNTTMVTWGSTGPAGPEGPEGPTGPRGVTGLPGINGLDGTNGTDGLNGATGPQGIQGPAGTNGTSGLSKAYSSSLNSGLQLNSGNYAISASYFLEYTSAGNVAALYRCYLKDSTGNLSAGQDVVVGTTYYDGSANVYTGSGSLTMTLTKASTSFVDIECTDVNSTVSPNVLSPSSQSITAVLVNEIGS